MDFNKTAMSRPRFNVTHVCSLLVFRGGVSVLRQPSGSTAIGQHNTRTPASHLSRSLPAVTLLSLFLFLIHHKTVSVYLTDCCSLSQSVSAALASLLFLHNLIKLDGKPVTHTHAHASFSIGMCELCDLIDVVLGQTLKSG